MTSFRLLRPLARTLDSARRDLDAATAALRGRNSPPFHPRDGGAWPPPRPASAGRWGEGAPGQDRQSPGRLVEVVQARRLGTQAWRLELRAVDGPPLSFVAGQFLTLLPSPADPSLRLAGRICSDPQGLTALAVVVEGAEPPGDLAPGARLRVLGPAGRHGLAPADGPLHHVMVSVGAGLASHVAMAAAALAGRSDARVTVVHADRGPEDAVHLPELETLLRAWAGRLTFRPVLEQAAPGWQGGVGHLDGPVLGAQLAVLGLVDGPLTRWYLAAPAGVVDVLLPWLYAQGVDPARVAVEGIAVEVSDAPPETSPAQAQAWPVTLRDREGSRLLSVPAGATVLQAARKAGIDLPFSCTMGGCGACRQHLSQGQVAMPPRTCLTPAERDQGYILACVARPLSPLVLDLQ